MQNTLYYGDNLDILRRYLPAESVDLIYLDPPFNSNRSYNVLFKDESGRSAEAQITAFDDTWHWGPTAEATYDALVTGENLAVGRMIAALRQFIGENQMLAYLVMMAARLVELHRVLKPTGSLYLHCDPTASHYLKVLMDTIFGVENYRSEITWKRTSSHGNVSSGYGNICDIIFYYTKSNLFIWNQVFVSYSENHINQNFNKVDADGRRFTTSDLRNPGYRPNLIYDYVASNGITYKPHPNGWAVSKERMEQYDREGRLYFPSSGDRLRLKRYLDEAPGERVQNLWDDINPISAQAAERLGYPTQKPLALLERILQASSNPGDVVLDPFSGCGTAISAAQKLGRRWIGIDITHLAIAMHKSRLKDMFNLVPGKDYQVIGEPADLASARQLAADDRYQFQWWALSLVEARPVGGQAGERGGKKGADRGIDGLIPFIDDASGKPKYVVVQVKSGHVNSATIRDLHGTMDREEAPIAVLITLEKPTSEMVREAVTAGFYNSALWQQKYPRIQILSIEELMEGKTIHMPPAYGTFKKARRVKKGEGEQGELGI